MTDVFISYAREDRKFVQRLHDALATEGRESWVDWEGIPASAKWMAEVRAAIDEADCFCFVVSPDSVESPVCREEAAHAAASNKRILPLLHREVADGLVPETVAAHNWIEFDGQADFDQAFATLVKALETEPEHLRAHTRLLVRSKEWESSERDRSHLLRGRTCPRRRAGYPPRPARSPPPPRARPPTCLPRARPHPAASARWSARWRSPWCSRSCSSAVAIVQRGEAKDAQALAEEQTQVANSRALAAQALLNLEDELDVGILLALEAYRTAPSPEALDVLHIAAQRSLWIERTLRVHEDGVNQVSYSPDGAFMASASADGAVILSDPTSGTPLHPPLRADPETVLGLAITRPERRWRPAEVRGPSGSGTSDPEARSGARSRSDVVASPLLHSVRMAITWQRVLDAATSCCWTVAPERSSGSRSRSAGRLYGLSRSRRKAACSLPATRRAGFSNSST